MAEQRPHRSEAYDLDRTLVPLKSYSMQLSGKMNAGLDNSRSIEETRRIEHDLSVTLEREYMVSFETDPFRDPRNIGYTRKWAIVVIVSLGSLCVYAYPLLTSL